MITPSQRLTWHSLFLYAAFGCVWVALSLGAPSVADAKTPGKSYCFLGVCHKVQTIAETERQIGRTVTKIASHYDSCRLDRFNPCGLTSSGEVFRPERADNAASPIYPNGTRLLIWNATTRKAAVVRVNNAGPYWGNRTLDVSRATAEKLGFAKSGVAKLKVQVISAPTKSEATYVRNRTYAAVPGPLAGFFKDVETAFLELTRTKYNLFSPPVHAIAGRQTPREALAFAKAERTKVTVVAGTETGKAAEFVARGRGARFTTVAARSTRSSGPALSARSAQELPRETVVAWQHTPD